MKRIFLTRALAGVFLALALGGCASTQNESSTGEYVDDTVITTRVKAAILEDKLTNGLNVNVETFKGLVQLSGFVKNQQERAQAVELARAVAGVRQVRNDILIR